MVANKTIVVFTGITLTIMAVFLWFHLNGDVRQINKQLQSLTELTSKSKKESSIKSLQKAAEIGKIFNDPCILNLDQYDHTGSYSRKRIIDRILMVRAMSQQVSVSFYDTDIQVTEEKQANISTTMYAKGIENHNKSADIRELAMIMEKIDGDWLITSVTFVEVLEQ